MKTILSTMILVLASTQVYADGFYQQVIGNSPQADQQASNEATGFSYTPLYNQVTGSVESLAANESIGPRSEFTYTPLYLKVVGPQKPWSFAARVAQK